MKRFQFFMTIVTLLFATTMLGCGDIEDMIEKATERTISIERTILDSTSERSVKSVTVVESIKVQHNDTYEVGMISIDDLAERIEVSRLGLGEVRYFVRGHIYNLSNEPALLRLTVIPNSEAGELSPVEIGSITLAPQEELYLEQMGEMDQSGETIHQRLQSVFHNLDERYLIDPIIQVEGDMEKGVHVSWLKLSALPVLWRTEAVPAGPLSSYKKNFRNVYDATLAGSITNKGTNLAEVSIYLGIGEEVDPEADLIAHAFLAPGETLHGFELLVEGGAARIRDSIEAMIEGETVHRDFVVVSTEPLTVKGKSLRLEAKVVVGVDVF